MSKNARTKNNTDTANADNDMAFPSVLFEDFVVQRDEGVKMLVECPPGNNLVVEAQAVAMEAQAVAVDSMHSHAPLYTGTLYNYIVSASLNLTSLNGTTFVSDNDGSVVAVQVLVCVLEKVGFCTPFIHQEAIAELAAEGKNQTAVFGNLHGGTHIHSKYHFIEVPPEVGPVLNFTVTVPLLVDASETYILIASLLMFVGNSSDQASFRYDMANAPFNQSRILMYQAPPVIMEIPTGILYFSYVATAIGAGVIAFLLFHTVKHRHHQVLQLCQGNFLMVFLGAAFIATSLSFLLKPVNDVWCQVSTPIIQCNLTLFYAVTVGRLWRINAVISPLLMQTMRQQEGFSQRMMTYVRKWSVWIRRGDKRQGGCSQRLRNRLRQVSVRMSGGLGQQKFRKQITPMQLAAVVAIFTIPQVILQVLAVILQPRYFVITAEGFPVCTNGLKLWRQINFHATNAFMLLILILLFMAHATRNLPSLFNETSVIFNSTLASLVILVLGTVILIVSPSPSINYIVQVSVILSMAVQTSYRIMMPKLCMIWNGETVVVSQLVSDHRRKVNEDNEIYRRQGSRAVALSSINGGLGGSVESEPIAIVQDPSPTETRAEALTAPLTDSSNPHADQSDGTAMCVGYHGEVGRDLEESNPLQLPKLPSQRRKSTSAIRVQSDEAPSRRLILKMVNLQEQVTLLNRRIISGLAVHEEEWVALRFMVLELAKTFENDVKFAWETAVEQEPVPVDDSEGIGEAEILSNKSEDDVATQEQRIFQLPHQCLINEAVPGGGVERVDIPHQTDMFEASTSHDLEHKELRDQFGESEVVGEEYAGQVKLQQKSYTKEEGTVQSALSFQTYGNSRKEELSYQRRSRKKVLGNDADHDEEDSASHSYSYSQVEI